MIFLGDTHGNNKKIKSEIVRKNITHDTIIHVGDYGIGFKKEFEDYNDLRDMDRFLEDRSIIMYVIRGNHDNPIYFTGEYKFQYLKLLPDYSRIEVEGKSLLCMGGAVSVDRVGRIVENHKNIKLNMEERYWWSTEIFNYDEELLTTFTDIDIVVTHTAPSFVYPYDQVGKWPPMMINFINNDPTLEAMLLEERRKLDKVCKLLRKNNNIQHWYYGHFHKSEISLDGPTMFRCLGVYELLEHRT